MSLGEAVDYMQEVTTTLQMSCAITITQRSTQAPSTHGADGKETQGSEWVEQGDQGGDDPARAQLAGHAAGQGGQDDETQGGQAQVDGDGHSATQGGVKLRASECCGRQTDVRNMTYTFSSDVSYVGILWL